MRLEYIDHSTIEIIERIFEVLFDDLNSGMSEVEAGWRYPYQLGIMQTVQSGLLSSEIIERNSKGEVRLNFRNSRIRGELKKLFDLQFEQLDCFLKDTEKFKKAQKILTQVTELLQRTPECWKYVIALGWWQMLKVSEMPGRLDEILKEGISPEDWMIKAPRCSSPLALNMAKEYGEINDFKEAVDFLESMKICNLQKLTLPLSINREEIQKVMRVLRWEEIEAELAGLDIKMLGLLWTAFFVLDCNNLLPSSTEFSFKLNEIIWNNIENLLRKKQPDLFNRLENTLKKLREKEIIWAPDILHLPEVI